MTVKEKKKQKILLRNYAMYLKCLADDIAAGELYKIKEAKQIIDKMNIKYEYNIK